MTQPVCRECGFDYGSVDPVTLSTVLAPIVEGFEDGLTAGTGETLRRRPSPGTWSPLEYACHVRDVLLIQRDRLLLALVEDTPSFPRMYREERVELDGYRDQEPFRVAAQLRCAGELVGGSFGRVTPGAWSRSLVYNWPEPRILDIRWLAAHTAHEARHHLDDFRGPVR